MSNFIRSFCGLVAMLFLLGCQQEEATAPEEVIRAIKPFVVTEPAGGDRRTYSGTLVASDTSSLSFAVSGTVQTVEVSQGNAVARGEVLATLDPEPFDLDVQAAQAEVTSAEAAFTETRADADRQSELFRKGWVARAALDQAESAFDGAEAQLAYARSRLSVAQRNLSNATLVAPFAGTIAERSVEPFQETTAGQTLFLINAEGALEVEISVSDSVVSRLNPGATVTVGVPNVEGCGCTARITEIGTASGAANAVTVTASLLDGPAALLPGMAAEVQVPLSGSQEDAGFLVPLAAIAPGDDVARGYVFLFDPDDRMVRKTPIVGGNGVTGNLVAIRGEIAAGDTIAAAGVSFLRDGQRVKLLGE